MAAIGTVDWTEAPAADIAAAGPARRDGRLGLLAGAVALACLPWAALQARVLWTVPHYRFLPIVPLAAGALAARGARGLGSLAPGSVAVTFGLLAASWMLAAGADVVYSPTLGTLAALAALAGLAHGLGGVRLLRALVPAGLVLGLAVRPPLRLDLDLTSGMQTLATRASGRVLDLLGVYHLTSGNVLELPARRLYVEEACSGITSLFVVLAVTLCAALWARRGGLATAALLAAGSGWVVAGNTARIVGEAYALARWGVDLTGGWRHEALGLLVLGGVLGLVLSTDRLIARVSGAWWGAWDALGERLTRSRRYDRASRLAMLGAPPEDVQRAAAWRPPPTPEVEAEARPEPPRGPTRWPEARATWVGSWPVVVAFAAVAAANAAVAWDGLSYSAPAMSARLAALSADDLPARWGGLRREAFQAGRVAPASELGSSLRQWRFRADGPGGGGPGGRGGRVATVAVGDPYVGWHDAAHCYVSQGWLVDSRRVVPGDLGERVVMRMTRPLEGAALLVFGFDDARGEPLRPPGGGGWSALLVERLAQGWARLRGLAGDRGRGPGAGRDAGASYQVQVLVEGGGADPAAVEAEAVALFDRARASARRRVRPGAGADPGGSGGG